MGKIARYRRLVGDAKLPYALEYLTDILEVSKEPIVVFANHISVVEGLYKGLKKFNPLMIRGGVSAKEKHRLVKQFQTDMSVGVIVGNIHSMGVGTTLTRSTRTCHVEWDWTFDLNEQAEDRVHRMTQFRPTTHQYLVTRGSLDERMLSKVIKQQRITNVVMGT